MNHQIIESTILISNNPQVIEQIQSCFDKHEIIDIITKKSEAHLLSIDLPDLIIIDFTDWQLAFAILDQIVADPWLHYQNIISICSSDEVTHRVDGHKIINLITAISHFNILRDIPVVLKIIRENKALQYRRSYETSVFTKISGRHAVSNSLLEIEVITNLVAAYLFNANKIDISRKNRIKIALSELFLNALEHGNCEIGFKEKSKWLEAGKGMSELIKEKCKNQNIAKREIRFFYEINQNYSDFTIEDDGAGFDWQKYVSPNEDRVYTRMNGRGIIMAHTLASRLEYNTAGNSVKCSIDHKELSSNNCPAVLSHIRPEIIPQGTTIVKEGDRSSYLYFIYKGSYLVSINDKPISILTPDDIFMGEMAFMLNGRRSATITSISDGEVVMISKKEFIAIIREFPYYSLFLAKILAQRLSKSHS